MPNHRDELRLLIPEKEQGWLSLSREGQQRCLEDIVDTGSLKQPDNSLEEASWVPHHPNPQG